MAAVVVAVTAAAVAGVLATRGGATHATAVAANAVGLIDTRSGRVSNQVPVGQAPTSVAVGEDAVWAANERAGSFSIVLIGTRSTTITSVKPDGLPWASRASRSRTTTPTSVSWINPQSNTVVKEIHVGSGPTAVAYGFGSIWSRTPTTAP